MCQITLPSYENGVTNGETIETIDATESFTHIFQFPFVVCGSTDVMSFANICDQHTRFAFFEYLDDLVLAVPAFFMLSSFFPVVSTHRWFYFRRVLPRRSDKCI